MVPRSASALTLVLSAVGTAAVAAQTPGDPSHYAIQNARIVTAPGRVVARGTIVFRDGLITAVGPSVTVPAGAWVIDGTGLTVYPGLTDALSTLGLPAALRLPEPRAGGGGPGGGGRGAVPRDRPLALLAGTEAGPPPRRG
jgi:hypothetical protein